MCITAVENKILDTLESTGRPVEFRTLLVTAGFERDRGLFETAVSELVLRRCVILTKELKLAPRRVKSASFGAPGWRGCEDMPDPTASAPTEDSCVLSASRS